MGHAHEGCQSEKTDYIFRLLTATQSDTRGYLLTGEERFADDIARDEKTLAEEFPALRKMIMDNPRQGERFQKVLDSAKARLDFQRTVLDMVRKQGREHTQEKK